MKDSYEDIIGLPHHVSATRPQMSLHDRAAQFAPFSALTGYDAVIRETGRLTEKRIELDEGALDQLNAKLQLLLSTLDEAPEITFTYFKPDARKAGGAYQKKTGVVKQIEDTARLLVLWDGTKIPMDDILNMEGDVFAAFR